MYKIVYKELLIAVDRNIRDFNDHDRSYPMI